MLIATMTSVAALQAQSVEAYINGTKMNNGDTIVITSPTVTGEASILHAYAYFKNVSTQTLKLTASKTASLPEGVEDAWCIFGNCVVGDNITSQTNLAAGKYFGSATDYVDITPNGYVGKDIIITYTISSQEIPADKLTFTIRWDLGAVVEKPLIMMVNGEAVGGNYELVVENPTQAEIAIMANLYYKNQGTDSINLIGEKVSFLAEGTHDAWCTLGGCWDGDFTARYGIAPGQVVESTEADGQYLDYTPSGYIGDESVVYYTVYAAENPYNRVTFAVRWKTTGVSNDALAKRLKMVSYPNPATEVARIAWEKIDGNANLSIRSVSGQTIAKMPINGETQMELNVANWTPGMYFYSLEKAGAVLGTGKLVVR